MSCCSQTTATNGVIPSKNQISPQFGQGIYSGIYYPGSTERIISSVGHFASPTLLCEHVIQTDTNYISSLSQAPQNVLRLTGQNGNAYIQTQQNLYFTKPYTANSALYMDVSAGSINTNNVFAQNLVSKNAPNGTGGEPIISQFNSFTLNGTSTITSINLAVEPISGGASATLRMNFYDGTGVLRWVKDFS